MRAPSAEDDGRDVDAVVVLGSERMGRALARESCSGVGFRARIGAPRSSFMPRFTAALPVEGSFRRGFAVAIFPPDRCRPG